MAGFLCILGWSSLLQPQPVTTVSTTICGNSVIYNGGPNPLKHLFSNAIHSASQKPSASLAISICSLLPKYDLNFLLEWVHEQVLGKCETNRADKTLAG